MNRLESLAIVVLEATGKSLELLFRLIYHITLVIFAVTFPSLLILGIVIREEGFIILGGIIGIPEVAVGLWYIHDFIIERKRKRLGLPTTPEEYQQARWAARRKAYNERSNRRHLGLPQGRPPHSSHH